MCVHCCALATLSRGALLFLATFAAVFIFAAFRSLLPRTFFRFPFSRFSRIVSRVHAVTFAVPLQPNTCNVHFIRFLSGFKRVICSCVPLHRLPYFVRLYSLICGKFAVLCGVGVGLPPNGQRREAQLRSRRILKFPKKFFLKNLLPLTPCRLKFFFWKTPLSPMPNPLFS